MRLKKVLIFLLCVGLGAGIASGAWYYVYDKNITAANSTIDILNTTINSIGESVEVYTLSHSVQSGDEIKETDLMVVSMSSSAVHENWITDKNSIIGKYYKIDMQMYTPLTTDMIMDEQIDDTTRERDLCFDKWPVGLEEGDYVDVRLVLPYGEEYIVIPKVRVNKISANSIQANLTEEYWDMYTSALVDYYLHLDQGASIYLAKYVEPGTQEAAIPYYSVRPNIKAIMQLNPNIVGLASTALNDELRSTIDTVLDNADAVTDKTSEDEQAALEAGRTAFSQNVNADYNTNAQNMAEQAEEAARQEEEEALTNNNNEQTTQEQLTEQVEQLQEGALE